MSDPDGQSEPEADAPPSRIVGRMPTPRTLLITEDDELAAQLEQLFTTPCTRVSRTWTVREDEYDLVVATEPVVSSGDGYLPRRVPAEHLFLVTFGVEDLHASRMQTGEPAPLTFRGWTIAREYELPPLTNPALRRLVEGDLLPAVQRRSNHHPALAGSNRAIPTEGIVPLLKTTDGNILAALFVRPSSSLGLALPADVTDHVGWVRAALQMFRKVAPERFQRIPGWEELPEWSTAKENRLREELAALEQERDRALHDLQLRENTLRSELTAAAARAEARQRLLLTAQHDELPEAVAEALNKIGFDAKLMDPHHDPNNRLEDLRVTDPQASDDWEVIAEVRGYKGGASPADLFRATRWAMNYEREAGRPPSGVWYIVNQFAGQDPSDRPAVLASQPGDLAEWAATHNGLAVDTAVLFRLIIDVDTGRLSADEARRLLRSTSGRLDYPTAG